MGLGVKYQPLSFQPSVCTPPTPHLCLILTSLLHATSARKASRSLFPPSEAPGLDGPHSVLHLGMLCPQLPPHPALSSVHSRHCSPLQWPWLTRQQGFAALASQDLPTYLGVGSAWKGQCLGPSSLLMSTSPSCSGALIGTSGVPSSPD